MAQAGEQIRDLEEKLRHAEEEQKGASLQTVAKEEHTRILEDKFRCLEEELKVKPVAAEEKKIAVEAQPEDAAGGKAIVDEEAAKADVEAAECEKIATEVTAIQKNCEEDLANAEPLVNKAMAALDTLNKKDLGECKSMSKPPAGVDDVFAACMVLLAGCSPSLSITTNKKGVVKDRSWGAADRKSTRLNSSHW